jgi:hypothetical protein
MQVRSRMHKGRIVQGLGSSQRNHQLHGTVDILTLAVTIYLAASL